MNSLSVTPVQGNVGFKIEEVRISNVGGKAEGTSVPKQAFFGGSVDSLNAELINIILIF